MYTYMCVYIYIHPTLAQSPTTELITTMRNTPFEGTLACVYKNKIKNVACSVQGGKDPWDALVGHCSQNSP